MEERSSFFNLSFFFYFLFYFICSFHFVPILGSLVEIFVGQ